LHFRFILQPVVAVLLAVRAGCRDARQGRPAFFWTAVREPTQRLFLMRQLWKDVGKLFLVAVVLDVIYQILALPWVYPVQTLIVATLLAIVPYLVFCGLANRFMRAMRPEPPPA
jgi:hypothetical protein